MMRACRVLWCRGGGALPLTGTVTEWHPFERRGRITEKETGAEYVIADTRAFETVLPTLLRALNGATVTFLPQSTPSSDRVITRKHTDPVTSESYKQRPPTDFLRPFDPSQTPQAHTPAHTPRQGTSSLPTNDSAGHRQESNDTAAAEPLYATNIIVDLHSLPSSQLVRIQGPLVDKVDDVLPPTSNLKDMRSSKVLDADTLAFLRLRRVLGSDDKAREELRRQEAQRAQTAVRREVVSSRVVGLVVAWSALHRSGVIVEGLREAPADAVVDLSSAAADASSSQMCIIRNVNAFESALPTSNHLLHRRVTFDKVSYSSLPGRFFAERIEVEGDIQFDDSAPTIEETVKMKAIERANAKRAKQLGTRFFAEEEHVVGYPADRALPEKPLYGVVTRWSGGQGVIESGEGHMFYVHSGSDFNQLVDQDSHTIRGAVVSFRIDAETRRLARDIDILSTSSSSLEEMKPMLARVPGSSVQQQRRRRTGHEDDEGAIEWNEATGQRVARGVDAEPVEASWQFGLLLSWSSVEGQGIIHADDGTRYVLRDAADNVIAYKERRGLLKNGRKVKFTAFGSTGKLACNVVPLDAEADEAELRESELRADEPKLSLDGNMSEAIASPMSTSYWLSRMDKAGYDVSEVKQLQNRALTLDEDDGDDGSEGGKFMDSDDLIKNDSWFSDPKKNVRFPNSDITAGHLAMLGPASMMNMAMKAKDPKKLEKMTAKYQSRLTEDQKEFAWKQAKEMAPKYESIIKRARERNEEPRFYFV